MSSTPNNKQEHNEANEYSWLRPPTDTHTNNEALLETMHPSERFRLDCAHNYNLFTCAITRLLHDIQHNRSRVLCLDGIAMRQHPQHSSSSAAAVGASAGGADDDDVASLGPQLSRNKRFSDGNAELTAAHLRQNSSYLVVALRNLNDLTFSGITALLFELSRHQSVRVVDLRGTLLTSECLSALKGLPRENPNIIHIALEGCMVPDEVAAGVSAACRTNLLSHTDVSLVGAPGKNLSSLDILRLVVEDCDAEDAALRTVTADFVANNSAADESDEKKRMKILSDTDRIFSEVSRMGREEIDLDRAVARFKTM